MKTFSILTIVSIAFLSLAPIAYAKDAKTLTIYCPNLTGESIYYFSKERPNDPKDTFIKVLDSITGTSITLIWDMNKTQAQFLLPATPKAGRAPNSTTLHLMVFEKEQITFAGLMRGAPILFSFYPLQGVAVYTQHSNWYPFTEGIRVQTFPLKCTLKTS